MPKWEAMKQEAASCSHNQLMFWPKDVKLSIYLCFLSLALFDWDLKTSLQNQAKKIQKPKLVLVGRHVRPGVLACPVIHREELFKWSNCNHFNLIWLLTEFRRHVHTSSLMKKGSPWKVQNYYFILWNFGLLRLSFSPSVNFIHRKKDQ